MPDRLLHPARRWRTLRRLRARGVPRRVLFVCHGNICRSPYAQGSFERSLPRVVRRRIQVHSAGFVGPGRASPPEAVIVAAQRGVDLLGHRASLLTSGHKQTDWVFVMNCAQRRAVRRRLGRADVLLLGDLDPRPIDTRTVPDPVDRSQEVFEAVYARIDRCVGQIAHAIFRDEAVTSLGEPCYDGVGSEDSGQSPW